MSYAYIKSADVDWQEYIWFCGHLAPKELLLSTGCLGNPQMYFRAFADQYQNFKN